MLRLSVKLRGEDCTCINYPHNFLSPGAGDVGGGGGWGVSKLSGLFSTFQKMYLKQAKGPGKQW